MTSRPRLLVVVLAGLAATAVTVAQTPKPEKDWASHGHDTAAQRYSPLKQINTANVSNLQLVWSYDTPAAVPPSPIRGGGAAADAGEGGAGAPARGRADAPGGAPSRPAPRQSASTPLVVDGVMYMVTPYNRVVALDADTGKEIWVKDIGNTPSIRGLAYWPGTGAIPAQLVFGTSIGVAADLAERENRRIHADLRAGRQGRSAPGRRRKVSQAARRVVVAAGDLQEPRDYRPALAGERRALGRPATFARGICGPASSSGRSTRFRSQASRTTRSGKTISGSIAPGANAWGFITVDEERGIAYVPTGTPATDFYGGDRLGSNLYGSSLLALDATTGKLKWFFQTTHHDNWDYDLTAPPTLD